VHVATKNRIGKESPANRALDGSTHLGQKLARFAGYEKTLSYNKRSSLCPGIVLPSSE
jgi:hypothetical protein